MSLYMVTNAYRMKFFILSTVLLFSVRQFIGVLVVILAIILYEQVFKK